MLETPSCPTVTAALLRLQAGDLSPDEAAALRAHLAGCPACARRLAVEDAFVALLRRGLPRVTAPPGLETRIRSALAETAPARGAAWFARPWFLVAATAALLVVLLVPLVPGRLVGGSAAAVSIAEDVLVVDEQCDRDGRPLDVQRACTHPYHLNALRRAGGERWTVSPDDDPARRLLLDRGLRGFRVHVEGDLFPALREVRVRRYEVLDLAARYRAPRATYGGRGGAPSRFRARLTVSEPDAFTVRAREVGRR